METIGIIFNAEKDIDLKYTELLIKSILDNGWNYKKCEISCSDLIKDDVIQNSEIIICLGGDGTFLKTARAVYSKSKPILGINLGSLGFLTEVDKNDINNAVKKIIMSNYKIEERIILTAKVIRNNKIFIDDISINDIVVSRGALSRILHLRTYINDIFVDAFPGDGIIASSPTGSTGYSLSAGGPIVEPDIDVIIITPICPHILYSKSVITKGNNKIKIVVDEDYSHDAMLTIDGQKGYKIIGGDIIEIKKSFYKINMIKFNQNNIFNILRTKIYGRGEKFKNYEI